MQAKVLPVGQVLSRIAIPLSDLLDPKPIPAVVPAPQLGSRFRNSAGVVLQVVKSAQLYCLLDTQTHTLIPNANYGSLLDITRFHPQLVEVDAAGCPLPTPAPTMPKLPVNAFRTGDRFLLDDEEYILACPRPRTVLLISTKNGNRYIDADCNLPAPTTDNIPFSVIRTYLCNNYASWQYILRPGVQWPTAVCSAVRASA